MNNSDENKNKVPSIDDLLEENRLLKEKSRLLQSILENAPILFSAKDLKGKILFTSSHFSVLEGPAPIDYINRNVYELFPKEIADQLWNNDLKAQESEKPIEAEESVYHADGTLHTYHTTKFRLLNGEGKLFGTCAVSFDITHLKELEIESQHDHLTGLFNRRYFEISTEREMARAARENQMFVFAILDLDFFKDINDQFGHPTGDEVLLRLAECMKTQFNRPGDFCFRLGGDEFAATFCVSEIEAAIALLDSLRKNFGHVMNTLLPDTKFPCQVSIGVRSVSPNENITLKQLYADADSALYKGKKSGKNQCVFHSV